VVVVVMCGLVRLSSDPSEIKIKFMFDAAAPAPNCGLISVDKNPIRAIKERL
jgi:hypothetical protein